MSWYASFAACFGALLLLAVLIASWLLRTAQAPFFAKVAVPALIVGLACIAPYEVNAMLGFPHVVAFADLPMKAELMAFAPSIDEKRVDLWLRAGEAPPRAYEVQLDDKLKQTLREAAERGAKGEHVILEKRGGRGSNKRAGVQDYDSPEAPYQISESAFSLPNKGGEQ